MTAPAATPAHDPYAALRVPHYRAYLIGNSLALLGRQAVLAAATWQVYEWTRSATALGLVGAVNVLPLLALSLPAGAVADRHDRRRLIALGTAVIAVVTAALAGLAFWSRAVPDLAPLRWANGGLRAIALIFERPDDAAALRFDEPALPLVFLLLLALACARILIWPARASITPLLVPPTAMANAITWNTSAFEVATVAGPALGGILIATGGTASVYALSTVLELMFLLALGRVRYLQAPAPSPARRSWRDMLAGAEFIWRRKTFYK